MIYSALKIGLWTGWLWCQACMKCGLSGNKCVHNHWTMHTMVCYFSYVRAQRQALCTLLYHIFLLSRCTHGYALSAICTVYSLHSIQRCRVAWSTAATRESAPSLSLFHPFAPLSSYWSWLSTLTSWHSDPLFLALKTTFLLFWRFLSYYIISWGTTFFCPLFM